MADGEEISRFPSDEGVSRRYSCEIEEEGLSSELFEIKNGSRMASVLEEGEGSLFSYDFHHGEGGGDVLYVAIGGRSGSGDNGGPDMDALAWTLSHAVDPASTLVYLIHVFPELRHIPTPLGKLPLSQVNPGQKETYMIQERSRRREYLQKFLDLCSASKVKVETILIESDKEAKAILELIPILNIKKLVLGATKSSPRKSRSRRGIADQIIPNAPEFCEVIVICEGKQVFEDQMAESPSPSPRGNEEYNLKPVQEEQQVNGSFTCNCFKPKVTA
ncbi:hypothetical protein RJ639_017234 [Escallonia herrerae]|uniref:Uncharacterized protein n=1 Tax=Escallonia herrerae TaxID=1293975 RepID=A0AA89AKC3_9ASTE|nr:hypothetical protein RJ639_017234 [Escallonia herrerae]